MFTVVGATDAIAVVATTDASSRASQSECVSRLEGYASRAADVSALTGSWDLVLTDVEPFRASPFWWTLATALDEFRPGVLSRETGNRPVWCRLVPLGLTSQRSSLSEGG